ncbi:TonB-dependent receptor domain-containing protein [Paucibacter soli]|uniref:TonB-dependent receptor domain-containing protein n=1 Tax=Paucibacter soli TaxID=3133433 RepID=UPI0030B78AE4
MMKKVALPRHRAATLTAAALACAAFCAQAQAQASEVLQRVEVTGSHIKRATDEGSAPVQVLRREDLQRLGVTTVREMLDSLSGSNSSSLSDIGGSNSFASGASSASLRNMGKQSTLVLLNFRRVAPYPLADFNEVFTNLDALPAEAVERIEVLKSGGSSVYGSDAVAGVINIITRSNYEGLQASASHQQGVNLGKFANSRASLTGGFGDINKHGFNVLANLEMYHREAMPSWREVLADSNPIYFEKFATFGSLSTYSYPGNIIGVGPVKGCAVVTSNLCRYDRYSAFEVQPGADRTNMLVSARYKVAGDTQGYSELLFSRTKNDYSSTHALYGIGQDSTWGNPVTGQGITFVHRGLPAEHPFNPTGEEVEFRYRFVDDGAGQKLKTDQYRVLTGLQGTWKNMDWDLATGVMGGKTNMDMRGRLSNSAFKELVGDYNAEVLAADFFNKANGYKIGQPNSAEVLSKLFPTYGWDAKTTQTFVDGKLTGEIASWDAGPVGLATGFDLRHEKMTITPTQNLQVGDIVGLGTSKSDGKRSQGAVFAELSMPLTKALTLETAGRVDKYKGFNAHFSPKLALRYEASKELLLRATAEGGFRAPNLTESAESLKFSFNNGTVDPKRCDPAQALAGDLRTQADSLNDNDPNKALLLARADSVETNECAAGVANLTRNNPNLKPETSKSFSLGVVFAPAKGWNLSADYFNISRKNEIGLRSLDDLLASEASLPAGTIVRDKDASKDPSFRTAAERAKYGIGADAGPLLSSQGKFENLLKTRTSGIDFGLNSQVSTELGRIGWAFDATYLLNYQEFRTEINAWGNNLAGRYGYSRVIVGNTFSLKSGDFGHALRLTYNSPQDYRRDVNDSGWTAADCAKKRPAITECRLAAYQRLDYNISYTGFKNLTLSLNIRNLLDERPAIDYRDFNVSGGNIIPQNREDVQGRMYRVAAEYKFW